MVRAVLALLVAGCTVGGSSGGSSDGGGSGGGGGDDAGVVDGHPISWVDAATGSSSDIPCENFASNSVDGRHNTGKSCFQSCHNHGFTAAGTLYTNATGNTGFYGATITLIDNNNNPIRIPVAANGNFYTKSSIAFPALTYASSCPSATKMNGSTPNGDCNNAACHPGGTNAQIHLP